MAFCKGSLTFGLPSLALDVPFTGCPLVNCERLAVARRVHWANPPSNLMYFSPVLTIDGNLPFAKSLADVYL